MKYFLTKTSLLLVAILFFSATAIAQFTASGTVTDNNGEALIGVSVLVKGTALGTVTDFDGRYSINVPGNSGSLVFSYIGFANVEQEVSSSNSTVDLVMADEATQLDEVVITGLATTVKRTNLANSVEQVNSAELTGVTSQQTMDGALYGKFKGANISANSGAPGGGITVKLRGITSLNANSQPLYIVDGIYYDNSVARLGLDFVSASQAGGSTNNQDNPTSRIADLDPEDIETIEILKGASAAAIYGSRAAAGVVIINTKRGRSGEASVSISQTIGANMLLKKLGTRQWDEDKARAFFGDAGAEAFRTNPIYDYEDELYGNTGLSATSRLSLSGGSDKTQYFAGVTYKNDNGIVKNTGYEKTSFRLNLTQKAFGFLDLSLNTNYVRSSADRGYFNNDNSGSTIGISFVGTPPFAELHQLSDGSYPNNPFGSANFLQTVDLVTNNEGVNRFLMGGNATAKLFTTDQQSLKLVLRGGIDYYTLQTRALFPRELQFQKDGNGTDGASILGVVESRNSNIAGILVHSFYTGGGTSFRTQVGVTQENINQNFSQTIASFLVASQFNIDQASARQTQQLRTISTDKGFFVQEEINFQDKIIVTAGLRGDKSSRNGDANELYFYPKASLALNLSEFDFMADSPVKLKLRAAFGQSGNFAPFGAIYENFLPVTIDGSTGSLINNVRGNPNLVPERQTELEYGVDVGLLDNRVLFDLTLYNKNVDDLILPIDLSSSSGFTDYFLNAAAVSNNGVEVGLELIPLTTETLNWNARLAFWLNNAEVTRLDVPAYNTGAFGATLGTYRIEEGSSPTQLIGIGPNPGENGVQVYGDAEPDFQMSWSNSLALGDLSFNFLLHWKQGGDNINLSTLLSDLSGTSPDFDDTDLDPSGALANGPFRLAALGATAEPFIEDAGYVRLREVGLSYKIPKSVLNDVASVRVGVSGRNLLNFFSYNSYDPEVSNFGTTAISSVVEVTPFPSTKSVFFNISASF